MPITLEQRSLIRYRFQYIQRGVSQKSLVNLHRRFSPCVRYRLACSDKDASEVSASSGEGFSIKLAENGWDDLLSSLQSSHGSVREEKALVLKALKLSLEVVERSPIEFPVMVNASPLPTTLPLYSADHPLVNYETIAASLLAEQVWKENLALDVIQMELNKEVFTVVRDVVEIRKIIDDIDMIDDITAGTYQQQIFQKFDKHSILLEFVSRLDAIRHVHLVPHDVQVPLALDCLYIHVAIGRLLQFPSLSNEMEKRCMKILFPASYIESQQNVNMSLFHSQDAFPLIRAKLQEKINESDLLRTLVKRVDVKTRVKSTSSLMRKLLSLSNLSRGGRKTNEIFDVLGVRVIVWPSMGGNMERNGHRACYLIRDIARELWPVIEKRQKDYIKKPKKNGYQSLHSAHILKLEPWSNTIDQPSTPSSDQELSKNPADSAALSFSAETARDNLLHIIPDGPLVIDDPSKTDDMTYEDIPSETETETDIDFSKLSEEEVPFELQIRTKSMDFAAESGASSHAHYKSDFGNQF